jgi:hypothetical protein
MDLILHACKIKCEQERSSVLKSTSLRRKHPLRAWPEICIPMGRRSQIIFTRRDSLGV